jgi:hypothetical protein
VKQVADKASDDEAAWLEKIRQSGIRIDREGRFVHDGAEFAHAGLKRALYRWLDRLPPPDGRYVLRLDDRRFAYLDVDDTPLVARAARIDAAGRAFLALSDGSEEALAPETLTIDDTGVLYAWVRGGKLEARLASSAAATLGDLLSEADGHPQLPQLRYAGRSYVLRPRSAT